MLAPGIEGETLCFDDGSEADEIEYARAFGAHLGRPIQEIAPFLAPLEWYEAWVRGYRDCPHYLNTVIGLNLYEDFRNKRVRPISRVTRKTPQERLVLGCHCS